MARDKYLPRAVVAIATIIVSTLIPANMAVAGKGREQPIGAGDNRGQGKDVDLTVTWVKWLYSQPAIDIQGTNTNPALDSTGKFAAAGQEDGIGPGDRFFFLAGTFGGDAERRVLVPEGKTLFFPIYASEVDNASIPPTHFTVPQLRAQAAANVDGVGGVYSRLNGVNTGFFRTKSPTFDYRMPDKNSLYDYFGLIGPQFKGTIKPAVGDGYWVEVPPLPPGEYTLEFGGSSPGFSLNVKYFLTIHHIPEHRR